jgi:hypothetical protein
MNALQLDRVMNSQAVDIDLPLHPDTENEEHVALLVQRILHAIDAVADGGPAPCQTDVMQALSIATALRAALAEVSARANGKLSFNLIDIAVEEPRIRAA